MEKESPQWPSQPQSHSKQDSSLQDRAKKLREDLMNLQPIQMSSQDKFILESPQKQPVQVHSDT